MGGYFDEHHTLRKILLILLFLAGIGVRMLDLTDPPLDIHPTRQLHSAIMARGYFYETLQNVPEWMIRAAAQQAKREAVIEPPILEHLTAWGYQLTGGENVWIARLLSSIFWVVAGLAVYSLARKLTNQDGGLLALGAYLLMVYGVQASRTFQPDPLMVSLMAFAWWTFYSWREKPTWKRAAIAGLFSGLAIFVKNSVVFFLAIPYAIVVLERGWKFAVKDKQIWLVGFMTIAPAIGYTIYGTYIAGFLNQQFNFRIFPNLWFELANYSRWFKQVQDTAGIPALLLGLIGIPFFAAIRPLRFILGIWLGYIFYGLTFAYHIGTHDYYQLPFLVVLALSMSSVGQQLMLSWKNWHPIRLWKYLPYIVAVLMVLAGFWSGRLQLLKDDYRKEPTFWRSLGDRLRDYPVIGLTQDYGYRMSYYGWDTIENWQSSGDLALRQMAGKDKDDVINILEKNIAGKRYFLVTWFDDFKRQPEVMEYLDNRFFVETGDGYRLYDLKAPPSNW